MARVPAFLSHKAIDKELAAQVKEVLREAMPIDVFLSEEIDKAEEFRQDIWKALRKSKFFIFLYTDPKEDWSWCFFEAGAYHTQPGRTKAKPRIYCLHPKGEAPPKPLSNLQNTEAVAEDIMRWFNDMAAHFEPRPSQAKLKKAAKKIENAIRARDIFKETSIKPYIWITPAMPDGTAIDWRSSIPSIALENALVSIDPESQTKLGFSTLPGQICLLEFLKILDYDARQSSAGKPFWIDRFFNSIDMAARGKLHLEEVAYFRHEQGKIYRPVVVNVAWSEHHCKIKVVFTHAFGAPMTDHPTTVQRLADGVRLGVRTRLEVVNEFSGRLSDMYEEKKKKLLTDLGRQYTVGNQLIAALEAIMEEARAFGIRPEQLPPTLFDEPDQDNYERIRAEGLQIWDSLKAVIQNEDENGKYDESEKLLKRLEAVNEEYLGIALPRLAALLKPAAK
jgi:hypothetical protein